jgi:transposase
VGLDKAAFAASKMRPAMLLRLVSVPDDTQQIFRLTEYAEPAEELIHQLENLSLTDWS